VQYGCATAGATAGARKTKKNYSSGRRMRGGGGGDGGDKVCINVPSDKKPAPKKYQDSAFYRYAIVNAGRNSVPQLVFYPFYPKNDDETNKKYGVRTNPDVVSFINRAFQKNLVDEFFSLPASKKYEYDFKDIVIHGSIVDPAAAAAAAKG
jgi:hypothetical protein